MAGAKPTEQEKEQIRDLVKQGYTVQEIQQRFPHTDGRTIAGISVRIKSTVPGTNAGQPIVGPLPSDPKAKPVDVQPGDTGVKSPQQDAAEKTGFTPQSQTVHNPQGLLPSYREYFVIKKLDGADSGIIRTEQPPFGIVELYDRYQPGDYEIQHYRDGRLFATYRERIAPKTGAISGVVPEAKRQETPADFFLKAMDVYHKLRGEQKVEETVARREEVALAAEKERSKAQVETAATVGLIELVKETSKPKPDPNAPALDRIFTMMQESSKSSEARHKQELEVIREKAKADLELERERIRADAERQKNEALERERNQQAFLTKMQELDAERQKLWKESYDRMIGSIKEMQDSMVDEFEKKKDWLDSYAKIQKDHTDEIIKLKREMGTGASDIKMAEIVKDGIVGAVDRIGHRVDTLVNAGVIGKQGAAKPGPGTPQASPSPSGANASPGANASTTTGGSDMPSQDALKAASKEPWFQDLQDEIARTVKRRKNGMVLHGSMLGQTFLDRINSDAKYRVYFHYLCSRDWSEILVDAQEGLKPEHKDVFADPECAKWFGEFQGFLIQSWNASVGIRS